MKIAKVSPLTGVVNVLDLDVTQAQLEQWQSGVLIQNAMSHLSADEREFLITGYTPEDWDKLFSEEE